MSSESSDSSDGGCDLDLEVEDGNLDRAILKTLVALKFKDGQIYDKDFTYFDCEELDTGHSGRQGGTEKEKDTKSSLLSKYFGPEENMSKNEMFLRNYLIYEGWRNPMPIVPDDSTTVKINNSVVVGSDEEDQYSDAVDDYERDFNFRHDKVLDNIGTYSDDKSVASDTSQLPQRTVKESRRKRQRTNKLERTQIQKEELHQKLKEEREKKKSAVMNTFRGISELTGTSLEGVYDASGVVPHGDSCDDRRDQVVDQETHAARYEAGEWWLCDACNVPIKPGRHRFDCAMCDFCLCRKCHCLDTVVHPHPLIRVKVPGHCKPPAEWKNPSLIVDPSTKSLNLSSWLDDKLPVDFEDIVDGKPVRFKYHSVPTAAPSLSTEQILTMSTSKLNRIAPLSELATYDGYPFSSRRKLRKLGWMKFQTSQKRSHAKMSVKNLGKRNQGKRNQGKPKSKVGRNLEKGKSTEKPRAPKA